MVNISQLTEKLVENNSADGRPYSPDNVKIGHQAALVEKKNRIFSFSLKKSPVDTRSKLKKLLSDDNLEMDTRTALVEEQERLRRLRQNKKVMRINLIGKR